MKNYLLIGIVIVLIIGIIYIFQRKKKADTTKIEVAGSGPTITSKYDNFFVRGSDDIVYWVENGKKVHWTEKTNNSEVSWNNSKIISDEEIQQIPFA